MENKFTLCQGVSVGGTEKLYSCYEQTDGGISGLLSGDVIGECAKGFIKLIPEPVFFFLELPCGDGEEYEVYYLDNCTKEVAYAIMERYGELLVNDGVSRFGFGSHKTDEEIYFTDYQEFMIYSPQTVKIQKLMNTLGAERMDKALSVWDLLDDDNTGSLSVVEAEGETVFDIPENLKSAGMYKADR